MPVVTNAAKRLLAGGGLALGFQVNHLRTSAVPLLAAATGHDWIFIDMEHGAFSLQEATQLCMAALPTNITPIVRICAGALDEGTRALDSGALGIVVPHVDTAQAAKRVAEAFRYPPNGHRSWGGPPVIFGFQPPALVDAQREANAEVLITVMIESPEAVANAEAIAAVDGVDVLLIGTSDLTADIGISAQSSPPMVADQYHPVRAPCAKSGKILGMGGIHDQENASRYIGMGARFILSGSDHAYIMAAGSARSAFLRRAAV